MLRGGIRLPNKIYLGMGTCGIAAGANDTMKALKKATADLKDLEIVSTGCVGLCEYEPVIEVIQNGHRVIYGGMIAEKMEQFTQEVLIKGNLIEDWVAAEPHRAEVFAKQNRIVLENCGQIDPDKIDDYLAAGGYQGLKKVVEKLSPLEVIEIVKKSGLRGRGGGGFSTGLKWQFTYQEKSDQKYIICNADEGDPGAFMDRSIMEGDPHAVIEGMTIAGYAVGSNEGYIYCRAEYPLAIKRLENAIAQAKKQGFLGKNILNTDFNFNIKIKEGAGAFVCGEETALIASIEGKMGVPRPRPPFPAQLGLWGKPTNINNVETYANVPRIIKIGQAEFNKIGTANSKGTKVFALTGKVNRTGLVEVPMGITVREIIFEIGGGIPGDKKFKAVQIGGPSGGCIPEELLELPVDYDSLLESGAMMGSGGLVTMDEETCMVDVAKFFLNFTQNESCGKCTPCREGTKRLLEILERITEGKGQLEDLKTLESLGEVVKQASLCGLGQTAPNPILSTIRFFQDEYLAHIEEKRCPAGVCPELLDYYIVQDKCKKCSICVKVCPTNAISGKPKAVHDINTELCIKCDACREKCPFDAIVKK